MPLKSRTENNRIVRRQISATFLILFSMIVAYFYIYSRSCNREIMEAKNMLENDSKGLSQKIQLELHDNVFLLKLLSIETSFISADKNYEEIFHYFGYIQPNTIFSRIDLILRDGTLVSQNGSVCKIDCDIDWDELENDIVISTVKNDRLDAERKVVLFRVPVKKDGKIIAALEGVFDCQESKNFAKSEIYNGKSMAFIVDGRDGNFVVDCLHNNSENLFETERDYLKEYENVDIRKDFAELKTGLVGYYSNTNGKATYTQYRPIGNHGWMLLVLVQDDVIFAQERAMKRDFIFIGIIVIIFIMLLSVRSILMAIRISKQAEELKLQSLTDTLTRCKNRLAIAIDTENVFSKAKSTGVVLCDMNGLKKINDKLGHVEGDKYICKASGLLKDVFGLDNVYRFGGDEFLAVVANLEKSEFDEKLSLAKKICEENGVSFSFGAVYSEGKEFNYAEVLKEADKKMYIEKSEYYRCKGNDRRR